MAWWFRCPSLFPALSSAGASLGSPCSVSTSRSSNRTGGSPASGSRRRLTLSPTESCVSVCPDEQDPRLHRDACPGTSRLHVLRACVSFATIDAASSSRNHLQLSRWDGAKIGSSTFGAVALTERVSKKIKLLFRHRAEPRLRVVHRQIQLRHQMASEERLLTRRTHQEKSDRHWLINSVATRFLCCDPFVHARIEHIKWKRTGIDDEVVEFANVELCSERFLRTLA